MFSPLPLHAVRLSDPLFAPRIAALGTTGLPHQFRMIKESGRLENFLCVARNERGSHVGRRYDDSDVYKWLEAVAYVLAHHPNPSLQTDAETVISAIAAAQAEDGYLNTFIQLQDPEARWTRLTDSHEVYCLGHLIEAGVAWKGALGDDRLLDVSVRAATLLERTRGENGLASSDGHAEA
ncbi:MAG: glycoside hydrolase family 127 protein, partial [Armatimonadota bacterium]